MNKLKLIIMILLYLLMVTIAVPVAFMLLLGCIIIYGALKVEHYIVTDIFDSELTDMWNKFIGLITEMFDGFKDLFRREFEV